MTSASSTSGRSDELLATATALVEEAQSVRSPEVRRQRRRVRTLVVGVVLVVGAGAAAAARQPLRLVGTISAPSTVDASLAGASTAPITTGAPVTTAAITPTVEPVDSTLPPAEPTTAPPSSDAPAELGGVATTVPVADPTAAVVVSPVAAGTTATPVDVASEAPTATREPAMTDPMPVAAVPAPVPDGPIVPFTFVLEDDGLAHMRGALASAEMTTMVRQGGEAVLGAGAVVDESVVDPRVVDMGHETFVTRLLFFPTGIAGLQPEHGAQLDMVVFILAANPAVGVHIEGYADTQGDPAKNLSLSQSRASRVREYLLAHGVNPDQLLETIGNGTADPMGDNDTDQGRAANRRVALHLTTER